MFRLAFWSEGTKTTDVVQAQLLMVVVLGVHLYEVSVAELALLALMAKASIIVGTELIPWEIVVFKSLLLVEDFWVLVVAHLTWQNVPIDALISFVALPCLFEKLTNGKLILNIFMQEIALVLFLTVSLQPKDTNLLFGFSNILVAAD